jgi:hypothetical protein
MLPVLLGAAAGASWLFGSLAGKRNQLQKDFPFIPYGWWTPRDRLFYVKERALVTLKQSAALNSLYDRYANEHPDHAYSLLLRSTAASNRGDWAKAREWAERLDREEPTLSIGAWLLTSCCMQLGDREGALAAARRFIALESDSRLVPHFTTLITRLEAPAKAAAKAAEKTAPAKGRKGKAKKPRRKQRAANRASPN